MALSDDELAAINRLTINIQVRRNVDEIHMRYYRAKQRLAYLGIAIPPEMRFLETIVNWNRTVVDTIAQRLKLRALVLPGEASMSPVLQEGWDVNNCESRLRLSVKDSLALGRGIVSVGKNEDDPDHPLITMESPREIAVELDPRTGRRVWALRLYGSTITSVDPQQANNSINPAFATLYSPDVTVWCTKQDDGWVETDRNEHGLGKVPVVPLLNRELTWDSLGESEMTDVMPLTDAAARTLTNLQVGQETHALPPRYAIGVAKGDFVDADGNQMTPWESYFSAIWATGNKDASIGQLTASSLGNFHDTVNHYAQQVSGLTGLPMRYLGQVSTNPPSADGIRADESRLIANVEDKQLTLGDQISEIGALYLAFKGTNVDGRLIKAQWFDAGTQTYSAKVDGVNKLTGGKTVMSVEGAWDEMGWTEDRKQQERAYLLAEQTDPVLKSLNSGSLPVVRYSESAVDSTPATAPANPAAALPAGK